MLALGVLGQDLQPGQSVCVNGVCLTAVALADEACSFNVITETLSKTNLGQLRIGSAVNIERSLRPTDRFEGHIVQGHVQGLATVVEKIDREQDFKLTFSPLPELMIYCAPLGCVAINGVSLTIAKVADNSFSVALIPTTLERTNLGELKIGDQVNLETDIMARQIVHYLQQIKKSQ